MKFTPADIAGILAVVGSPIDLEGVATVGYFCETGKPIIRDGATFITSEPILKLSETDAAAVLKNDTIITIEGVAYQAYQKTPDGSGFVELDLTRDF